MAKIRKIYDETIKPDGSKTTIYPITSTRAVYTPEGATLDSYLKDGYFHGADLRGYKTISNVTGLPTTENQFGWLIGEDLYVWVGTGGDTLGGLYQNCGHFRTPYVPDDEDLVADSNNELKLKDRTVEDGGMGYVILRKELAFAEQIEGKTNTIFEIRYDFDLDGESVTVPEGCILDFKGGVISNGVLICNNLLISSHNTFILSDCILRGTIIGDLILDWFVSDWSRSVSSILNTIISNINAGTHIKCVHSLILSEVVNIDKNVDISFKDTVFVKEGASLTFNGVSYCNFSFKEIVGDYPTNETYGIVLVNSAFNVFNVRKIRECKYGIFFDSSTVPSKSLGQNIFYYTCIQECDKGIYFKGKQQWDANVTWAEGNEFLGGFIVKCNVGIHLEDNIKCGNSIFVGPVDCIEVENSYDIVDETNTTNYAQKNIYINNFLRAARSQFRTRDTIIATEWGFQSYGAIKTHDGVSVETDDGKTELKAGTLELAETTLDGGFIDLKKSKTSDRDIRIQSNGDTLNIQSAQAATKVNIGTSAQIESTSTYGRVALSDNKMTGNAVGMSVLPVTGNRGASIGNNVLRLANAGKASMNQGDATMTVGYSFKPVDSNYLIFITPSWDTTFNITTKSVNGFVVNFGTAAPADASFDWIMFGVGIV